MKEKITDIIFQCRKCGHLLYIDLMKDCSTTKKLGKVLDKECCPKCGEEHQWMYYGLGNFDKEWGEKE